MARGSNLDRIGRLEAAHKKARKGQKLSLTELAALFGVAKGTFVNTRNKIAAFPDPEQGSGNQILYPAKAAIKALLDYETRADDEELERQKQAAAIIGAAERPRGKKKTDVFLPPSEMLKLSRLRAEIEERQRQQGEYVPISEMRNLAARIYGVLNDQLSQLELRVDPNGLLPAEVRLKVSELGRAAMLEIHRDMSDTLGVDVDDKPSRAQKAAKRVKRARKA